MDQYVLLPFFGKLTFNVSYMSYSISSESDVFVRRKYKFQKHLRIMLVNYRVQ